MNPKPPTIGINYCCELMRANRIPCNERTLIEQIQAGLYQNGEHAWAYPSVGTKKATPNISRARFIDWVQWFYKLEEVIEP